jgi:hypothetical protein
MKKALLFIFISTLSQAQVRDPDSQDDFFSIDTPITVNLQSNDEEEEEDYKIKEKKRKKKVFYGIKTKKRYTRDGEEIEQFYVLKEFEMPDPYVRDVYWFDYRRQQIRVGGTIDRNDGFILHGPYKKIKNGQVLEEGIFYKGTKHGRWVRMDKDNILLDKEKYYRGWPRESMVSYYDRERKKMKEIIPVEYGEKEGYYYYFHENGKVAVQGEFHWDAPVGEWTEYYPSGYRKKVIQYDEDPFDQIFRPFTLKEWDIRGRIVYEVKP